MGNGCSSSSASTVHSSQNSSRPRTATAPIRTAPRVHSRASSARSKAESIASQEKSKNHVQREKIEGVSKGSSPKPTHAVFKEEEWHEEFLQELNRQRFTVFSKDTNLRLNYDICLLAQKEADRLREEKITIPGPKACNPKHRLYKNTPCRVITRITNSNEEADMKVFLANAMTNVKISESEGPYENPLGTDACFWLANGIVGCAKNEYHLEGELYVAMVMMFHNNETMPEETYIEDCQTENQTTATTSNGVESKENETTKAAATEGSSQIAT